MTHLNIWQKSFSRSSGRLMAPTQASLCISSFDDDDSGVDSELLMAATNPTRLVYFGGGGASVVVLMGGVPLAMGAAPPP
jgi:hypothetical protein